MTTAQIDEAARAEIGRLLASGRKIDAIKQAREAGELDLAGAKRLVEAIEAGPEHLNTTGARLSDDAEARIRSALAAGRRGEAVRLFRKATGSEMKAAHDAVRAMEGGFKHAGDGAVVQRGGGRNATIAVIVAVAALLVWYLMGTR